MDLQRKGPTLIKEILDGNIYEDNGVLKEKEYNFNGGKRSKKSKKSSKKSKKQKKRTRKNKRKTLRK